MPSISPSLPSARIAARRRIAQIDWIQRMQRIERIIKRLGGTERR